MQPRQSLQLLALLLCTVVSTAHGHLSPNTLLPFGVQEGDANLFQNDDRASPLLCVDREYMFFGKPHRGLFVNTNGLISFEEKVNVFSNAVIPSTHTQAIIAPFWGDVDTELAGAGTIFYRKTSNPELLSQADEYVHAGFAGSRDFRSTELFIATWDRVGYYDNHFEKVNTFQCVLVSDGRNLFTLFLYKDIQWTTGDDASGNTDAADGLGGIPAQVGFNAGDMINYYTLPMSQTSDVVNIENTTNIGVPGAWVFLVSGTSVVGGGCTENQIQVFPSFGNILGGDVITLQGCLNGDVICDFGGVQRSATSISNTSIKALCVVPPLRRVGMVTLRVLVDGQAREETNFTSVDVEASHQVDVTPSTGTLSFSSFDTLHLRWSPETILPLDMPTSSYRVDIVLYELDPSTDKWTLRATLLSNTPNDGEEVVTVTSPPIEAKEIAPVAIQVIVNQGSIDSSTYHNLTAQPVGKWSSQFYYLQPLIAIGNNNYQCMEWYNSESRDDAQTLLDRSMACPPRKEQAILPNSGLKELIMSSSFGNTLYQSQWLEFFHPGAQSCFKERAANMSQKLSPRQECCYGDDGSLLTGPPKGGRVHKGTGRGEHYLEDTLPYMLCCKGLAPRCQLLYSLRPSDNGGRYDPPSVAWMMGDPHLVTLDNHPYTFNGQGEFSLIETIDNSLTLQGRMTSLETSTSHSATVFTALAAKEGDSDVVMVTANGRGLDVYVNSALIDLGLFREQIFNGVVVFSKEDETVGVSFDSGAYVEARLSSGFLSRISVSLPRVYMTKTRGLLGVYNGNHDDDLTPSVGEKLALSSNDTVLHDAFGKTWKISQESSLFTYLPYESFSSFSNPQFTPTYITDYSVASAELASVCQADSFCLYDGLVSGDMALASETLATRNEVDVVMDLSMEVTCSPPCENGVCVSSNTCACSEGYNGATCATPLYTSCDSNPCPGGQRCGVLGGSHYCESDCNGEDNGAPLCQLTDTSSCSDNPCLNGGVCSPNNSLSLSFSCFCVPGYRGILCGISSTTPPSPCEPNPCQNGGTCSVSEDSSSYDCLCVGGYSGDNCSVVGTNIVIAAIAGAVVGSCVLVLVIGIALLTCWAVCSKRRKKTSDNNTLNSDVELMKVKSNSQLLYPQRKYSLTSDIRSGSTTPGSSDPHLHKAHRLTLSREPLIHSREPLIHTVLRTSPTGGSSSNSLDLKRVASLQSQNPHSMNHLPVVRCSSTLPATGRSNSNTHIDLPNGARAQSQLECYHDYSNNGQRFYSTQSMNLSQSSPTRHTRGTGSRRASVNTMNMPAGHDHSRRASAVHASGPTTEV